jgi:hypothetical protein
MSRRTDQRRTVQGIKFTLGRTEGMLKKLAKAVNLSTGIPELAGSNLDCNKAYVTEGFRRFPQIFHANAEILIQIRLIPFAFTCFPTHHPITV